MSSPSALLRLEGVGKRFGRVSVAAEVSFSVPAGQALGIVGPNGAGKTSLFGLISGDLSPDAGRVIFDGRDVTGLDAARRCRLGIGRTYQVPRSFAGMTVFENALVAAQQGGEQLGRAAYALALSALERCSLLDQANVRAGTLTLLARKRLEVARALATRPRLILLDEVAGGLTDAEVAELVEIVRQVREAGVTLIWIEHVVRALTRSVERLICLADGRVLADGDPAGVLASDAVKEVYLGGGFERSRTPRTSRPAPGGEAR